MSLAATFPKEMGRATGSGLLSRGARPFSRIIGDSKALPCATSCSVSRFLRHFDVDTSIPEPSAEVQTLRDRVAKHLESPSCAGCHKLTDPIGLDSKTLMVSDGIENGSTAR